VLERIVPERESAREGTIYVLSTRAQLSGDVPQARSAEGTIKVSRRATANPGEQSYSRSAPAPCWNLGFEPFALCLWSFFVASIFALILNESLSPRGEGRGEGVMVRLLNILKATSRAAEAVPVGYFFSHLFCSNAAK
jgi:hypothetical protein